MKQLKNTKTSNTYFPQKLILSVVTVLLLNVILSKQRNVYIMQHMAAIKYIHNDLVYQSMADGCTEGCSVFVPPYTYLPFRDIIHSICFCWNVVFLFGHLKTTKFHIILKPSFFKQTWHRKYIYIYTHLYIYFIAFFSCRILNSKKTNVMQCINNTYTVPKPNK